MTINRHKREEMLKHMHMAVRSAENGDVFGTIGAMMQAASVRSEILQSPGLKFEDVDPIVSEIEYVRDLIANMILLKVGAKKDINLADFEIDPETRQFKFELSEE